MADNEELVLCARFGELDELKSLIAAGADVNHRATGGSTALHMASANGFEEVVAVLLASGAEFTANDNGNTPLHWAVQNGHAKVAETLLDRCDGALVLAKNAFGKSALTEAFGQGSEALLKPLLEHHSAKALDEDGGEHAGGSGDPGLPARIDAHVDHTLVLGTAQPLKIKIRELGSCATAGAPVFTSDPRDDQTGVHIWAASLILGHWISDNGDALGVAHVACELGAGCGVPGIVAATRCPRLEGVILSDVAATTLDNLRHNVRVNSGDVVPSPMRVQGLDWADAGTWPEGVDLVLGADLVYAAESIPALVSAVYGLLPSGGRFVYVAPSDGRQGAREFVTCMAAAGFDHAVQPAPEEYLRNCLGDEDDDVFEAFFPDAVSFDFLIHQFVKHSTKPASRWAYLPSWARSQT